MKLTLKFIIPILVVVALVVFLVPESSVPAKKMIILGVDGLDPRLLQKFTDEGNLPNFKQLIAAGDFKPLQTTMPPLSPVAWSTFITGMDPGGHAIFDFLHRDPKTIIPEFSMARTLPSSWNISIGSWVLPLKGGTIEQLRLGRAFWEILEEHNVPTTVFRMPVNFPPSSEGKSLSGMGTPDILGTPGMFSFYTDNPPYNADDIAGGHVYEVEVQSDRVDAQLIGPENTFRRVPKESPSGKVSGEGGGTKEYRHPKLTIDFQVFLDPEEPVAKFVVQADEFILKEGEWSDWVRVDFEALPYLVSISAVGRFYLQEVRPDFRLYVTPLQINPEDPVMPISTPDDWARELYDELGYFYTQELPEDTKAFSGGIFDGLEFWEQAQFVFREQRKALDHLLKNYKEGFLFFYFSSVDQGCHMLWRYMDPEHPGFVPEEKLSNSIEVLYRQMDEALGRILEFVDGETTLIVMSDHGFSPFYWGVNLNSWLVGKGYARLKNPLHREGYPLFMNVDWAATKAYALGLNGLYVNLRGREKNGIVSQGAEYEKFLDQLETDLLAMEDPRNGQRPIAYVVQTRRDFRGNNVDMGPDIIVGYNWGYRTSWESPLGEFPREIFVDNIDPWSGTHLIDYRLVPGVLITNRKITLANPALYD
ncbi:alkaline phosphatase family protein, partial [Acidobacteria bacterium AH-259-O06]|nr:alkaline phosphatase family protein [Acidobacteria bacterium AH-259-O06]